MMLSNYNLNHTFRFHIVHLVIVFFNIAVLVYVLDDIKIFHLL